MAVMLFNYCCLGKKNVIFRIVCKCGSYGRFSRGGAYLLASDGKAPLKERPLPPSGGGGGGPGDRLEDRARALSFVYDPLWERCKCDIITTLLELCRTYSAPGTNGNECGRACAPPSVMSSFQDFKLPRTPIIFLFPLAVPCLIPPYRWVAQEGGLTFIPGSLLSFYPDPTRRAVPLSHRHHRG